MLTLLGIILIHQNGLKWCKTLDIALLGNRAPGLPGRPRIGTYVRITPRDDRIERKKVDGGTGDKQYFNIHQALQWKWR